MLTTLEVCFISILKYTFLYKIFYFKIKNKIKKIGTIDYSKNSPYKFMSLMSWKIISKM
jgi:hypothetical protein